MQAHESTRRPIRPGRAAQTLVEFALILPVLITVMVAIFDFSYYFFVIGTINSASRFAVRRAAMNNLTRAQIKQLVVDQAVGTLVSVNHVTVTTVAKDSSRPNSPPTVQVVTAFTHRTWGLAYCGVETLPVKSDFKSIVVTDPANPVIVF